MTKTDIKTITNRCSNLCLVLSCLCAAPCFWLLDNPNSLKTDEFFSLLSYSMSHLFCGSSCELCSVVSNEWEKDRKTRL